MATFVRPPTVEELKKIDRRRNFATLDEDLATFAEGMAGPASVFNLLMTIPNPVPLVEFPRTPGYRPTASENKYNQWFWKCSIKGATSSLDGKPLLLTDKRVAVKDSIMVAGVPMSCGSQILDGYTPETDATVVNRVLRHGAEIVGKTTVEDMCLAGTGFMSSQGPVRNPWRPDALFGSGGSSGGSAVAVAMGDADMALGGDQGGSIRIPSCNCGIVGLKPTFGLVPYTGSVGLGAAPIASAIDSLGPMTRTVDDCATLLEAIAGFDDNRDQRQPSNGFETPTFTDIVGKVPNVAKRRIGVLKQGFSNCDPEVTTAVNKAIDMIRASNKFLEVVEVDFPEHLLATPAWSVASFMGIGKQADFGGNCAGDCGVLSASLTTATDRGLRCSGHTLSPMAKSFYLFADYVTGRYGPGAYARAQTVLYDLRKKYDRLFTDGHGLDVLLMPTLATLPLKFPDQPTTKTLMAGTFGTLQNTAPFNSTHHPAITLNCGYSTTDKLPVGVMLVGRHWHDYELLEMAKAVETILKPLQRPWPQ